MSFYVKIALILFSLMLTSKGAVATESTSPKGPCLRQLLANYSNEAQRGFSAVIKRLGELGWEKDVLRRLEKRHPDFLSQLMSRTDEELRPEVVYRGIGVPLREYSPVYRGYDEIKYVSPGMDVAMSFTDGMVIEYQIPRFWITKENSSPSYLGHGEIRIPIEMFSDDRMLMKRIGFPRTYSVKRGRFTRQEIETQWFSPEDVLDFDKSGRVRSDFRGPNR